MTSVEATVMARVGAASTLPSFARFVPRSILVGGAPASSIGSLGLGQAASNVLIDWKRSDGFRDVARATITSSSGGRPNSVSERRVSRRAGWPGRTTTGRCPLSSSYARMPHAY